MMKRIYCRDCWQLGSHILTETDKQRGYRSRIKFLAGAHGPPVEPPLPDRFEKSPWRVIRLRTVVLQCDLCGKYMPDGSFAVASSVWNMRDQFPDSLGPPDWESEFGTVIPEETYRVGCVLEGKP